MYVEDAVITPVTVIEAGPMAITQIRTKDRDGYDAIQVGSGTNKKRTLREFKVPSTEGMKVGDVIDISSFSVGQVVKVSGKSKGRGFQGAVKRHGFAGMPASHGHHHVMRHVGSIGQRFPQHTLKGMRMAGHMGDDRVTTRGLKVVFIDKEKNLIALKGAIPGARNTLVEIVAI